MSNRERLSALIARARTQKSMLTEAQSGLSALRAKIDDLKAATYWAELDSGASVAIGTRVRYFGRWYVCKKAHTKALLRSPSNGEFWEAAQDDE